MYAPIKKQDTQQGFVALTTALIVSVSLLVLVIAVGFEGFFTRYSILETDQKEKSIYLAEACVNDAILELATNDDFAGGGPATDFGSGQCRIDAVTGTGNTRTIFVTASSSEAFTHLEVEVNISSAPDIDIVSWEETL